MGYLISMREVAQAAGVSKAAVSRVINGRPANIRIADETRERILSVVRQTGYQPDRFVREMTRRHPATIGLVLASTGPDASASHLPAIESVLAAAGYQLLLIVLPLDSAAARDRVNALMGDGAAGLLCVPGAMPIAIQAVSGSCPVVTLGQGAGETILKELGVPVPAQPKPAPSPITNNQQPINPTTLPPLTPSPVVVAAVPSGTAPEPSNPVPEPELTPVPVSTLNNHQPTNSTTLPSPAPVPASEPEPEIELASTPEPAPPATTIENTSLNNQQPDNPTTFPPLTPPSDVVAAVPGGTDTEPPNPVPELAVTPIPASDPESEIEVMPTPEPLPEPAMNLEPTMASIPVSVEEPAQEAPIEEPVPVSEPELAVEPAPPPVLNNQQPDNPTTSPSPEPAPINPEPVQAEPVYTPPPIAEPVPVVQEPEPVPPESAPSMPDPTPTPPPSVTPVQEAEIPPQNPESVQAESGQNQPTDSRIDQ